MYTIYTAIGYKNHKNEMNYWKLIGIPVPTNNIKDIKAAMFLMEFEIYRIEKGGRTIYESTLLSKIMNRGVEKMADK